MSHLYANWHKLLIVAFAYALLAGCATPHPSRNMKDMSASEIERALSEQMP